METKIVQIENKDELNFIFGQSHFIKTVEDLYEALVQVGHLKFGIVCTFFFYIEEEIDKFDNACIVTMFL